jgi:type IV pilus assembly protein PilM
VALQKALVPLGRKRHQVATAVHGIGVLTKRITIPKVPKGEIPDQIKWEAEQVFPADVTSIITDYLLLGEGAQVPGAPQGTRGWDVLLIGIRKDHAEGMGEIFLDADAQVKVMDLDAFCCVDGLSKIGTLPLGGTCALVDIGASATRVAVLDKGKPVFIREFSIGGAAFTDAISQSLGLSFEDAEALKIQDPNLPQGAIEALQPLYTSWANDLQQSEDIYMAQENSQPSPISRFYFYGGGILSPGLMEFLQRDRFQGRVMSFPFEKIFRAASKSVDSRVLSAWAPRLITAAGLMARKA